MIAKYKVVGMTVLHPVVGGAFLMVMPFLKVWCVHVGTQTAPFLDLQGQHLRYKGSFIETRWLEVGYYSVLWLYVARRKVAIGSVDAEWPILRGHVM